MNSAKKSLFFPYLALATASIIWGANTPIMKVVLQSVPLFSLAFIRFFFASILLLPFIYKELKVKKEDIGMIIFTALFGVTFLISLVFWGYKLTSALNAGILNATMPIFNLLIAYLFLKEHIYKRFLIGILFGVIGVTVIISKDFIAKGFDLSPIGDTLIIISMVSFAIYDLASKKLSKRYNPLVIVFYSFLIGSILFLPAVSVELQKNPFWWKTVPSLAWIGVIYGVFFSSLVAFSLWQWGIGKVMDSQVGFFLYLQPIVTGILAVLFLHEVINVSFIIGSCCIFLGLIVAERHKTNHPHIHV